jgi:hypothetical protein
MGTGLIGPFSRSDSFSSPLPHPSKAISIRTTLTPLEGGWARLESFSGKGYGQTVGW